MTSYFLVADLHVYGRGEHRQGVIATENYQPKPAFYALQSMAYLFDAKTKYQDTACIEVHAGQLYMNHSFAEYYAVTAGFERGNIPVYAWYFPENIEIDYGVRRIRLDLWVDDHLSFEQPVIIDPVTRKVYKYKKSPAENRLTSGVIRFYPMPMLDYPLFLSDIRITDKTL